jgi:hypothetical protein
MIIFDYEIKGVTCELKWIKNEFKVLIDAHDCFYQEVDEGSVLVTSFQVEILILFFKLVKTFLNLFKGYKR